MTGDRHARHRFPAPGGDLMRFALEALVAAIVAGGIVGGLTALITWRDCRAQAEHSPYHYVYEPPFSCVYAGVKPWPVTPIERLGGR